MELIRDTVAPSSWAEAGGSGTMEFFPLGLALVVYNSPAVQEEVAQLLAALRRLQDVEVAVEMRLVTVPDSFFERIDPEFGLDCNAVGEGDQLQVRASAAPARPDLEGVSFLDADQFRQVLEAAQGDRRTTTMQAPRLTVFNGQRARIDTTAEQFFVTGMKVVRQHGQAVVVPRTKAFRTGFRCAVRPVVSADRRCVLLHLRADLKDLAGASVPAVPVTTHLSVTPRRGEGGQIVPVTQLVQQPSFQTLSVDKSFSVADGKTAVVRLGTRLREGRVESGADLPLLDRVPYLNRLFTNVGYARQRETVLLLITPHVVVNEEEEQAAPPSAQ
jgi:general secretion pathway protein D